MHELGVLRQALGRVQRLADEKGIGCIKHVALDVGEASGFVPEYFRKLYPAARELYPALGISELKLNTVPGRGLVIKEIAY